MTTDRSSSGVNRAPSGQDRPITVLLGLLAVTTAFVFVITQIVSVPLSFAPGQRFDGGDIAVFISALTFGPIIGGFAGAVGSGLSDAVSPSPYFAPFTFVIKGLEGFIAGWFAQKGFKHGEYIGWGIASAVMVLGYFLTNWLLISFFIGSSFAQQSGFGLYTAAIPEAPFDVAQVVAGGLIGFPVSRRLKATLPARFLVRKT